MESDVASLVRRLYEDFWNAGNQPVADEIIAPHFIDHHVPPDVPLGPAGVREWAARAKTGFPDFRIRILDMVVQKEKAACLIEFGGTHTGEFSGIPPTGNRTSAQAMSLFRAESGQLVEAWEFADVPTFLAPLGLALRPAAY